MIIDIQGDGAHDLLNEVADFAPEPFRRGIIVQDADSAIDNDAPDTVVYVVNGFTTSTQRNEAMEFFKSKRTTPRIVEIHTSSRERLRSSLIDSMNCPYTSIVYVQGNSDFRECITEVLKTEEIVGTVRDLFGEDEAELVHRFIAGTPLDPMSSRVAIGIIQEAKMFDESRNDDAPVLC